jgi:hypothetical protein
MTPDWIAEEIYWALDIVVALSALMYCLVGHIRAWLTPEHTEAEQCGPDVTFEFMTVPATDDDIYDDRWFPEWTRDFYEIEDVDEACPN